MRIIAKKTLVDFCSKNKDAEQSVLAWHDIAKRSSWRNFNEIKVIFKSASVIGNDRIVFNIKGNDYRLVVKIDFIWQVIYIRFIGTHEQYDKIDAKKI